MLYGVDSGLMLSFFVVVKKKSINLVSDPKLCLTFCWWWF